MTTPEKFLPVTTSVYILHMLAQLYGVARVWRHKGDRPQWFDQLYGTATVRQALIKGVPPAEIVAQWRLPARTFLASRRKMLLYS